VDYYSYAYTSDPIVAGFIQESGTINGFGTVNTTAANAGWFNVTTTLGCGSSSSNLSEVLACMRTKSTDSILKAIPQTQSKFALLSSFSPAVDNITVFSDYPARSAAGNFIKAPLLSGNTDYEAGLFATIAALSNVTYPREFWDAFNLRIFTCPAGLRANISISAGVPTWRYRYFGDFPNLRLTSAPESGAWHVSELPILFDNTPKPGGSIPADTDAEISIGSYMRGAWVAFAKDPANGLKNYQGGWPIYDPSASTLVRLAYNNITGTNLGMPSIYDTDCGMTFSYNGTSVGSGNATTTVSSTVTGAATSATTTTSASLTSGGGTAAIPGLMLLVSMSFCVSIAILFCPG
jgi:cholinesterase